MRRKETIRLSRLSTGYWGKHHTVRVATDIEASLYGGELTCLLGANGAGKSTLLRTLSASQPPVSGEIWIGEKRLAEYADKELAKLVGIVLTERCDVENLTVEELVGMGRTPYTGFWGTLRKEDKQIVSEAMRQVGITKLSGTYGADPERWRTPEGNDSQGVGATDSHYSFRRAYSLS